MADMTLLTTAKSVTKRGGDIKTVCLAHVGNTFKFIYMYNRLYSLVPVKTFLS